MSNLNRAASRLEALNIRTFSVSPRAYAEFLAKLDRVPNPNERLRKTMQTLAPWDCKTTQSPVFDLPQTVP